MEEIYEAEFTEECEDCTSKGLKEIKEAIDRLSEKVKQIELYQSLGQNTDGAISQKVVSDEFDLKLNKSVLNGGSANQVLSKVNDDDLVLSWKTMHEIIAGGKEGQALVKASDNDYDVVWDYVKPKEFDGLCLTSTSNGSIVGYRIVSEEPVSIPIQKSTDKITWEDWDGTNITLNSGEKIYVKNLSNTLSTSSDPFNFVISGSVEASGDISSMINYSELSEYCYAYMFDNCTGLTKPPVLPATALAYACYESMFNGCTSLTTPPELPATILADNCYSSMFSDCTSLTSAPSLPATALATSCYQSMFNGCSAISTIPPLPATYLSFTCYASMFYGCVGIRLSETEDDIYQAPYRIPTSGSGTADETALIGMFDSTGGTFTGTPTINTTYYLAVR